MLKEFFIIKTVEKSAEKLITHVAKTNFNKHKSNSNSQYSQSSITYNTEIYNNGNSVAGSNTVSLVCAHCGGTMAIDKDSSVLKCPYCGSTELIQENNNVTIAKIKNDTQKEIELKKLEMEEKERQRKYEERKNSDRFLIRYCMCMVVLIGISIFLLRFSTKEDEVIQLDDPNMAAVAMSSSSYCEKNYQQATDSLKKSGFTNITCEPVYDIYFSVFAKEGEVDNITINDIAEFDKNDVFPKDAEIVITYHLSYSKKPNNTEVETTRTVLETYENVDPGKVRILKSSRDYYGENYQDVLSDLYSLGFKNVKTDILYDVYFGFLVDEEDTETVSIDGISDFSKGDIFSNDAEVIVTFHLSYTDDPTYSQTTTTTTESKTLSYSTNDKETAKNGNSGVFSYRSKGGTYYIYYIIDFDEGYVYRFVEGNGDETCDRLKIESGDLNSGVTITYNDGDDTWSNWLHFKWQNQSENLTLVDNDYFEYEFKATNLTDALSIRDKKRIIDY